MHLARQTKQLRGKLVVINQEHFRDGNPQILEISIPTGWDFSEDDEEIFHLLVRWQEMLSPGTAPFTIKGYEDLFVSDSSLLSFYDASLPYDSRVIGVNRYQGPKLQPQNRMYPNATMYHIELDRIYAEQEFAASYLCAWSYRANPMDMLTNSHHVTHIWRKESGVWRIAHEHVSEGVKEAGYASHRFDEE